MISTQVTPPNGWQYNERGTILVGDSFDDLTSTLISHRTSNAQPVGNCSEDIKKQLYDLHPSIRVETLKMISDVR